MSFATLNQAHQFIAAHQEDEIFEVPSQAKRDPTPLSQPSRTRLIEPSKCITEQLMLASCKCVADLGGRTLQAESDAAKLRISSEANAKKLLSSIKEKSAILETVHGYLVQIHTAVPTILSEEED